MKQIGFLQAACTLTVALLLAACSQDDFSGGQEEPLPEGKYPLKISSVSISAESSSEPWMANAPKTRLAESTDGSSSQWSDGDLIGVQIPGSTKTGEYRVKVESGTVMGIEAETALYWENRDAVQVKCWYPADTSGIIRLDNQDNDLVYLLYGETNRAVDYKTNEDQVHIEFKHLLSKIRVRIIGEGADDVKDVMVNTYYACKFTPNAVRKITSVGIVQYIPMKKVIYNNITYWEANVLPNDSIRKFKLNGLGGTAVDIFDYPRSEAGMVHEITLKRI